MLFLKKFDKLISWISFSDELELIIILFIWSLKDGSLIFVILFNIIIKKPEFFFLFISCLAGYRTSSCDSTELLEQNYFMRADIIAHKSN